MGLVGLVGLEEVDPEEDPAIGRHRAEVGLDLRRARRRRGELDLAVLEVEPVIAEALEAIGVDEEDRGRVEPCGPEPVAAQVIGPRLRVPAHALEHEGRMYFPVISEVTAYEVCGVGE